MTHDELLDQVQKMYDVDGVYELFKALRAVVELLKDYNDGQVRVNEEFNQGILAFSSIIKDAIEKELA